MKNGPSIAVLAAALILVCSIVAWEWYSHIGSRGTSAPKAVQAVTAPPSHAPAATSTPAPSPAASATPTTVPVVYVPVSAPSVAPSAVVVRVSGAPATRTPVPFEANSANEIQSNAALATLAPNAALPPVIRSAPNDAPRILAIVISAPVARGGQVVSGLVETTSNVASVEARIGGYSSVMSKIGVGRFALSYRVPNLPFFMHHTYSVQVIARNARGQSVSSALPITIK